MAQKTRWDGAGHNTPHVSAPAYGKRAADLRFADEEQGGWELELEQLEGRATMVHHAKLGSLRNPASGLDVERRQTAPQLICQSSYVLQRW